MIYIFTDENITYKYIYYIGVLLDNKYNLYLDFSTNSHIMEITELKFSNLEELKAKIRKSELGVPEDDEIKDVYSGVKSDLEKLKRIFTFLW